MEDTQISHYFFLGLLLVLTYFTYRMVSPFFQYVLMALILTYLLYPVYKRLRRYVRNPSLSSGLMVVLVLLVLIIPSTFIIRTLISQASSAVFMVRSMDIAELEVIDRFGIQEAQVEEVTGQLLNRLGDFIIGSASNLIGSLPQIVLGIFVLFFLMYYGFKEGPQLFQAVEQHIPLEEETKTHLLDEIHKVSHGVLYGQVLTAVIQGTVGGIGLLIFDVPNAVFWGFIMIVLCFFPVVGTPIVWGPAALFKLAANDYTNGIGLLIYGSVLAMNIDNVLRPQLISEHAQIHPVVVLVGVLGGLVVFGFSGLILGPLIMALLISLLRFYNSEQFDVQAE